MVCFVASALLPVARRGTIYSGMAHSSYWYITLVEGLAGDLVDRLNSGPRPPDGFNLWPALLSGGASPRTEVVHQVSNEHYNALTGESFINGTVVSKGNGDGCLGMAIRMGEMKLIVGNPGQNNVATYPTPDASGKTYAFGASGGIHEEGTGHCRAPSGHTHGFNGKGEWLFNLSADLSEVTNLAALANPMALLQKLKPS